jgi:Spy/CpxP family protein refolding chaperone
MTRTRWVSSFALLAVLATGTCVFAQGPGGRRGGGVRGPDGGAGAFAQGPGGPGRGGFGLGVGMGDLDLSDAQRQQIRAITTKAREESRSTVERFRQAAEARRKAVVAMPVDENQIRAATQSLAAAEADLAVARAHVQSDIFTVLTPEQQAKATQARERRETRMNERRSRVEQRRQQRQNNN